MPLDEDIIAIVGFFFTVIVVALGYPLISSWTRRKERMQQVPPRDPENDRRLERIEHAVEAMAVEVERISEGQRFVTKLLAERSNDAARAQAALPPRTD
jgi:hypothetical protein